MTLKDLLLQELDNVSDPLILEVLDFLRFLKTTHTHDSQAFPSARANLTSASQLDSPPPPGYPLRGKEPYRYEDPFVPAAPLEEWDVLQ
ncbi:MAG: hypothetical protein ACFCU9_07040 [Cyanophyceae cyanobacterium]